MLRRPLSRPSRSMGCDSGPVLRDAPFGRSSGRGPGSSRSSLASGLIPLHPLGARFHRVVVPLEPELLLAEDIRLEALPGLQLEVVERTALGPQPMRHARREKYQRAGFELLGVIADLDHATALERDVAVGGTIRIGRGADMPMIGRRSAIVIAHLAGLNGVGWREPAAIEKPDGGLDAEAAHPAAA